MGTELVFGDLDGANIGLRVAMPGYDVFAEPLGSRNIAFDSRLIETSTVVAQGTCQMNQPVGFPAMPYVPVAMFNRINPDFLIEEYRYVQIGTVVHTIIPYVGLITSSYFVVLPYVIPFYNTNVGNASFAYTVFGIQP